MVPMIREPAVAGHFYPSDPETLRAEVERFLLEGRTTAGPSPAAAVVVPHAGYVYSGRVAGAVYAAVDLPRTLVILCPNHTGRGRPVAVMSHGGWRTPLGTVAIAESLADRLLRACPLAQPDETAHRDEHALEVQIPFLQLRLGEFSFVPVCVGTGRLDALLDLGGAIHEAIRGWGAPAAVVVSSDKSHYVPAGEAREKDLLAIDRMAALDPEGLHRVVMDRDISMCGVAPAVAGLEAARRAGARAGRLIAYANSGDASGDYQRVVGYAGLAVA